MFDVRLASTAIETPAKKPRVDMGILFIACSHIVAASWFCAIKSTLDTPGDRVYGGIINYLYKRDLTHGQMRSLIASKAL